jgi:YgiT-type zinc finger domain-containing protein
MTGETFIETTITYAVEVGDRFVLIENVPVRICVETGEQLFSPATAEKVQQLAWGQANPARVVETPVFDFAA